MGLHSGSPSSATSAIDRGMSNCTNVYGLKTQVLRPVAELVEAQRVAYRFGLRCPADDEHTCAEVTADRVLDDAVTIDRCEHVGECMLERRLRRRACRGIRVACP